MTVTVTTYQNQGNVVASKYTILNVKSLTSSAAGHMCFNHIAFGEQVVQYRYSNINFTY